MERWTDAVNIGRERKPSQLPDKSGRAARAVGFNKSRCLLGFTTAVDTTRSPLPEQVELAYRMKSG